jgi:hypothetical protein
MRHQSSAWCEICHMDSADERPSRCWVGDERSSIGGRNGRLHRGERRQSTAGRVVITQGLVLYGTLKAKGVPVRLVYYPNEGHWIESRNNALHWWEEVLGWLDRWLG